MAKNFKGAAATAQPVYSTLIGNTQQVQDTQDAHDAHDTQDTHRAQGQRGQKRINMAFTPDNLDYMRVMAAIKGETMTSFVNRLVAQDLEKNKASYEVAKKLAGRF